MTTSAPSTEVAQPRLASLTSLRWFAASAVFLRHSGFTLVKWAPFTRIAAQGNSGVSFFFILSGFVLAWSHRPETRAPVFYQRRFARIYPSYFVVAVLGVPFLIVIGSVTSLGEVLRALVSLTLVQAWIPSVSLALAGTGVAWSLSAETFFYLLFPLLISRLTRLATSGLGTVAALAVVTSIAIPLAVRPHEHGFWFWFLYFDPVVRTLEFVLGMCLCLLMRRGVRLPFGPGPAAVLALGAYLAAGWAPVYLSWYAITLVPYALLIFASAQRDLEGRTSRLLASKRLNDLGVWSYAFYLVHVLVVRGMSGVLKKGGLSLPLLGRFAAMGVAYVVAIAVSHLIWRVVEHPFEQRLRAVRIAR